MDQPSELDRPKAATDNDRTGLGRRPLPNLVKVVVLAAQPPGRSAVSKSSSAPNGLYATRASNLPRLK